MGNKQKRTKFSSPRSRAVPFLGRRTPPPPSPGTPRDSGASESSVSPPLDRRPTTTPFADFSDGAPGGGGGVGASSEGRGGSTPLTGTRRGGGGGGGDKLGAAVNQEGGDGQEGGGGGGGGQRQTTTVIVSAVDDREVCRPRGEH